MTVLDDLDRLWREVRHDPYRYDDCVQRTLTLSPSLPEAFARVLLTDPHSPSEWLERYLTSQPPNVTEPPPLWWSPSQGLFGDIADADITDTAGPPMNLPADAVRLVPADGAQ